MNFEKDFIEKINKPEKKEFIEDDSFNDFGFIPKKKSKLKKKNLKFKKDVDYDESDY